jgi:hypothetical protein
MCRNEGEMGHLGQWLREKCDDWGRNGTAGAMTGRNGTAGAMTEGEMGQLGQWLREKWDSWGNDW